MCSCKTFSSLTLIIAVTVITLLATAFFFDRKQEAINQNSSKSIYDFTVLDIDGNPVKMSKFKGNVLLIVNVASRCGYTPQYEGLQAIYEKYKEKGFYVLGFPANNFGNQEPGTNEEIKEFCTTRYRVTFPMFAKISVKGQDQHPLYKFLTDRETNPEFGGEITWNFNKFLIDRNGKIVARFSSKDKPESQLVIETIEKYLNER
ncbi:MAG: glutathione peroxidase [Pyrinomonadaceae bacterium]|nr:glutathione peroxidase [Pyrinomonadaceae bacterium]